ncbi:hypothetical protein [Nocardioides mangrovi]|uniref:Uncharacterized protein n=1 Tax=Nocardioides mangrovi TaxID=2874580 RepID=A0ABS7UH15_9ACTN|nr:hypothetical protein [Nocardioides mangrovi]MBZ5740334.1 hypothetical protein [Nocardioides mangrovi]
MSDYRSERMPSVEGRGRARAAWDAYKAATRKYVDPVVDKTPLGDAIRSYSANRVGDALGFWVMWKLYGGFEGLQSIGMTRSSIFRKVGLFRQFFGVHPDEFELEGVSVDIQRVWTEQRTAQESDDE